MPFLAMVADRSSSSIPKVVIASAPHTSYSIPLPSHRFRCLPAGRSSHASGFPRLRTCIHRLFRHAFSGTCNKDFPRLWTQLAGRPRNRYSAGIRSFRSTSPPFLIGVLRRPSYVTLPAQSNVQGGENMSESQEQTAVVEYCDIKALEQ